MRKVLWRAAVIVPLLAIAFAVSLKSDLFKAKVETTSLNPLASAEFENNKKAVESIVTPPSDNKIPVSDITPAIVPAAEPSADPGAFYVITGSFRSRDNAEIHALLLKREGFTPEILEAPNGFYRVSIMKCSDLPEALGQKDKILKDFPGSWVKKF
jgi:cell division protein FtsN